MSVRQCYDHELNVLKEKLLEMGNFVGQAIQQAVQSLIVQDTEIANRVITGDDIVDQMEIDIEDKCMVLIATQQPLARDLRIIGAAMKISTDLERMGDHAFDIANVSLRLAGKPLIKELVVIPQMAELAQQMVNDALEAFVSLDTVLAEKVCKTDDQVDRLYDHVFRELLTYMMEDPRTISQATQLLFVARYLERIADHATNICEWTIFLVTGQRLRKNI
jgi:phosphate transport system protein